MKERIIVDAVHTGVRRSPSRDEYAHRDLILLYDDGTWERVFKHSIPDDSKISRVNIARLTGKTRAEVIAELEELYYNDIIKGKFLV